MVMFYYVSLRSQFRVVMSASIFAYKRCSICLYLHFLQDDSCRIYVICVCCEQWCPFARPEFFLVFLWVCVTHLFNFVCVVLLRVFTFLVPYCDAAYKRCSVPRYLLLIVGVVMSYLHYLCMRIVVQFCLSSPCVLCTRCRQFPWVVHYCIALTAFSNLYSRQTYFVKYIHT